TQTMRIRDGEQLLEMMRAYQIPCLLAAAVDLDLFEKLAPAPRTAAHIAAAAGCDLRAVTILLDALAAVGVLMKQDEQYSIPPELAPFLCEGFSQSVVAMLHHQANCLRNWSQLPWTVQSGNPEYPGPSIRGEDADKVSFIEAMHVVSRGVADGLVQEIHPGGVRCVLDLGGASGSWTTAWLKAEPQSRAIIFDLPHVIPLARDCFATSSLVDRVELCAGNYYTDDLPKGADLAWVSAIIHQNSPDQNRALYRRIAAALEPNGWIYIRDIVMEPSRTAPVAGALFAVNMLSATEAGNSYSFTEIQEDLQLAGFKHVELVRRHEGMLSIVRAHV
ncbi:MAG: methyltransferase, partial [Deltaproteobacteria bacterium]